MRTWGERLRRARALANVGLRELGHEVGISAATLSRAEREGRPKTIQHWFRLEEWLVAEEAKKRLCPTCGCVAEGNGG